MAKQKDISPAPILETPAVEESAAPMPHFDFVLIVVSAFLDYTRGQLISEDEKIQFVIDKGYLRKCVKSPRN